MSAAKAAAKTAEKAATYTAGKYFTFWTGGQLLGIPIEIVVQIVGLQEITPMPELPNYAKGVINLRGAIIPVIDMRLRLGQDEQEYNDRTCIIVTNISEVQVGFIIDEVDSVIDITEDQFAAPPKLTKKNGYVTSVAKLDDKVALIVNAEKLLGETELKAFDMNKIK